MPALSQCPGGKNGNGITNHRDFTVFQIISPLLLKSIGLLIPKDLNNLVSIQRTDPLMLQMDAREPFRQTL